MKTLYFDCPAGISGDMTLGALLDLGVDEAALRSQLSSLGVDGEYELSISHAEKHGITGTQVKVHLVHGEHGHEAEHSHPHAHRHLSDITELIMTSGLPERVKSKAVELFTELAVAEGKVHGVPTDHVHFHEVGAVDSIVDIVGVCIAMDLLGADRVVFSPVNTGSGRVRCQHGLMPVPAPATAELLTGVPSYSDDTQSELTTPTGALIARCFATGFGSRPAMTIRKVGYGLGFKDFDFPNALRVMLGDDGSSEAEAQTVWELKCNLDDMTGEAMGYALERLLSGGALDAWYTPIHMKKNRPAWLLTALCAPERRADVERLLLSETTTLGVRACAFQRTTLRRDWRTVETPWGAVRVKTAQAPDGVHAAPEYEDCARLAREHGVPFLRVYAAAGAAAAGNAG
jgi:uncharacterized protein (TIGR00299 family) protein